MVEHVKRHNVDLSKHKPTLGPWLTYDPQAWRFTGENADLGNMLVREAYRRPFVVPEEV
jgi:hypothetical protein